MAGQVNIGGNTASVQLTGNDAITADQEIGFPNTNGESAVVIVTPTSQDIETTGDIECGNLDATGNITAIGRITNGNVSPDPDSNEGGTILYASSGGFRSFRSAPAGAESAGIDLYNNGTEVFMVSTGGNVKATGTITPGALVFNLAPDNPENYVSTTDAETGETDQVYSGPTLDVKDSLTKLIAAVTAIRAASQVAGTLDDLKSAITTATADFDGGNN